MYSIGEVAKMLNISISTLRYYDKEGLLINLERDKSGIRAFSDKDIDALRLIECLKRSGMQIKDIKEFMHWCSLGSSTIPKRKEMFFNQKENILKKIKELEKALDLIEYKCWYYTEAEKDENELRVKNITLNEMPKNIQELYKRIHN